MVIELLDGPLEGAIHEVHGNIPPGAIGLPSEDRSMLHWYVVRGEFGYYDHERTEDWDGTHDHGE